MPEEPIQEVKESDEESLDEESLDEGSDLDMDIGFSNSQDLTNKAEHAIQLSKLQGKVND